MKRMPLVLLALFVVFCHRENRTQRLDTGEQSQSNPAFDGIRKHSGGYVRGPGHDRVIVFVNGIFGDAVSTWQNGNAYWPALLESDADFNDVDIYVHSFDSPKVASAQTIDNLAHRMADYLQSDHVLENHKEVVFLCHSMGGLVTRAYLLATRPDPKKVPMIYFFATPTTGANVTEIARIVSRNPQLADMLPLQHEGYLATLQSAWLDTAENPALNYPNAIASYCGYETKDTFGVRIVERESATNLCNHEIRGVLADHIGIVKPADTRSEPYVYFKAAYQRRFGPTSTAVAEVLAAPQTQVLAESRRTIPILQSEYERVVVKQTKLTSTYIEVGCDEEKEGDVEASIDLADGESVLEVVPSIQNAVNIKSSSVALVSQSGGHATVHYKLRGLDRVLFNCPGGGHADIVANFVVTNSKQPINPAMFDRRRLLRVPPVQTLTNPSMVDTVPVATNPAIKNTVPQTNPKLKAKQNLIHQ